MCRRFPADFNRRSTRVARSFRHEVRRTAERVHGLVHESIAAREDVHGERRDVVTAM